MAKDKKMHWHIFFSWKNILLYVFMKKE